MIALCSLLGLFVCTSFRFVESRLLWTVGACSRECALSLSSLLKNSHFTHLFVAPCARNMHSGSARMWTQAHVRCAILDS